MAANAIIARYNDEGRYLRNSFYGANAYAPITELFSSNVHNETGGYNVWPSSSECLHEIVFLAGALVLLPFADSGGAKKPRSSPPFASPSGSDGDEDGDDGSAAVERQDAELAERENAAKAAKGKELDNAAKKLALKARMQALEDENRKLEEEEAEEDARKVEFEKQNWIANGHGGLIGANEKQQSEFIRRLLVLQEEEALKEAKEKEEALKLAEEEEARKVAKEGVVDVSDEDVPPGLRSDDEEEEEVERKAPRRKKPRRATGVADFVDNRPVKSLRAYHGYMISEQSISFNEEFLEDCPPRLNQRGLDGEWVDLMVHQIEETGKSKFMTPMAVVLEEADVSYIYSILFSIS